jgi:methionyl-tRNA formyltransferase
VLDIPRLGCLNIHASLLPRWRGAAPIQRAVQAGDERSGVTIMQMEAGLDTGPEMLRREIALAPRETGGSLHDRLAPLGAEAIVAALPGWATGTLRAVPQPAQGATYAAKLTKDEATLDWSRPAVELDRQVRAFNPWPVAVTTLAGEPVRIWQAQPGPGAAPPATEPGTVVEAADGRIVVATGSGLLELQTLQFPGRKPLAARDVLNSRSLAQVRFGAEPA